MAPRSDNYPESTRYESEYAEPAVPKSYDTGKYSKIPNYTKFPKFYKSGHGADRLYTVWWCNETNCALEGIAYFWYLLV